jgi:hypothetical protein
MNRKTRRNKQEPKDKEEELEAPVETETGSDPKEVDAIIRELFSCLEGVLDVDNPLKLARVNPLQTYFNKYKAVYKKTDPKEHYEYFLTIFNTNRSAALLGLDSNRWFRDGNIEIRYGPGIKKTAQHKIMLSIFYKKSIDQRKAAEKKLEGHGEDAYKENYEIIRDQTIYMLVYRIFHKLVEEEKDKGQLGKIVVQLEQDLGINEGASTGAEASSSGGLGGIFNIANDLLAKVGVQKPANVQLPTERQFSDALGGIFNNPQTQSAIGGMFGKLQGAKDLPDAINTLFSTLQDPQMKEVLTATIQGTVGSAAVGITGDAPTSNSGPPIEQAEDIHGTVLPPPTQNN